MAMSITRSGPLLPATAIALGAAIWGLYWAPLRAVEDAGLSGAWAVVAFNLPALAAAAIVLIFYPAARETLLRPGVVYAGAMAGAGLALYAAGLIYTSVVKATLLFYLTPIWGTLLAIAMLGERPNMVRWLAIAIAAIGLALTLGASQDTLAGFGIGEACGLASGFVWALGAVGVRSIGDPHPAALVFWQYFFVVIVGAAAAAGFGEITPPVAAVGAALSGFALAGSFAILASLYAIFWAMARMSPGRSGLLMMTEVVVAVVSAAILLPEEAMGAVEWLGAALIISAGVIEVMGDKNGLRA